MKKFSPEELRQHILRCNRCGTCQDVCPTFQATGNESDVARSRIRLARLVLEGKYRWDEDTELISAMKSCLLCKACVANCPSGVPTDEIMVQARNEINARKGLPWFNRLVYRGVFSSPSRVEMIGKLARYYQNSFAKTLVRKFNILRLFNTYGKAEELLPRIPAKPLRRELAELLVPIEHPRGNVVYFAGCAINIFYSRFGRASIQTLQENNIRVEVPEIHCCGGPHLSGGDFAEAHRLAISNIDRILSLQPDAILTDCATCSGVLKGYGELLADHPTHAAKAARFSGLVQDISQFLMGMELSFPLRSLPTTATFHDPCHLVRGQGIAKPPRQLLAKIPGLKLVEMANADVCCGGAGSYGVLNPDMSRKILERKMAGFKATGADYLVTSCPACAMQLEFGMRSHGLKGEVVHPVELLAKAMVREQPLSESCS